jgi:phosphatidylglycerol:prolipoprotein diacylglycerol transferase
MEFTASFSLILGIGTSLGLFWIAEASPRGQRIPWLLAAWLSLLGALLGARLAYVLEHLLYFSSHAAEIALFWHGGLAWEGALVGAVAVFPLIGKLWSWPLPLIADRLSRLLLPLALAAWIGMWLSGLGYGVTLSENVWWGMPAADVSGVTELRTPVQPLALASLLVFLGVLEFWLRARERRGGVRALATWIIFNADMLLFSLLRADPAPALLGWRIETWMALVYTLIGFLGTIYFFKDHITQWPHSGHRLFFRKTKKAAPYEIEPRPGTN